MELVDSSLMLVGGQVCWVYEVYYSKWTFPTIEILTQTLLLDAEACSPSTGEAANVLIGR